MLQDHMHVGCEFLCLYRLLTTVLAIQPLTPEGQMGVSTVLQEIHEQASNQLTKEAKPFHTGIDKSRCIPVYDTAIPWSLVICDWTQKQRGILVCG